MDIEGQGLGPRQGQQWKQEGEGEGLEGINSKFWNTISEAEGSDRADPGLMGRSYGRSWNQEPQKGELPITGR